MNLCIFHENCVFNYDLEKMRKVYRPEKKQSIICGPPVKVYKKARNITSIEKYKFIFISEYSYLRLCSFFAHFFGEGICQYFSIKLFFFSSITKFLFKIYRKFWFIFTHKMKSLGCRFVGEYKTKIILSRLGNGV